MTRTPSCRPTRLEPSELPAGIRSDVGREASQRAKPLYVQSPRDVRCHSSEHMPEASRSTLQDVTKVNSVTTLTTGPDPMRDHGVVFASCSPPMRRQERPTLSMVPLRPHFSRGLSARNVLCWMRSITSSRINPTYTGTKGHGPCLSRNGLPPEVSATHDDSRYYSKLEGKYFSA